MVVVLRHGRLTGPPPFAWPDATNTGPTGDLEAYLGDDTISSDGSLIENVTYSGNGLLIAGNNVTIRNCLINCTGAKAIDVTGANCTIEDCRIVKVPNLTTPLWAIGRAATVSRCDISGYQTGILVGASGSFSANYIHAPAAVEAYAIYATGDQDGVLVEDNSITMETAAPGAGIVAVNYDGTITDVSITHNRVTDATYPILITEAGGGGALTDITIANNHLEDEGLGYYVITVVDQSTFFIGGNVDYLTGAPV